MRHSLIIAVCLLFAAINVHAAQLPKPTGPVMLTVSGNITTSNSENGAEFDRDMLMGLGMVSVKTTTPWYDRAVTFEGPRGKVLLEMLGVKTGIMKVKALNDYVASVPVEDFYKTGAILAMKADGKTMRVRDRGPLFIIYPFDDNPKLKNDTYYTRSVWQIKAIHIE